MDPRDPAPGMTAPSSALPGVRAGQSETHKAAAPNARKLRRVAREIARSVRQPVKDRLAAPASAASAIGSTGSKKRVIPGGISGLRNEFDQDRSLVW